MAERKSRIQLDENNINGRRGPLEEPAGDWFVNRKKELDLFWRWGANIPHPGRRSYALIGPRRTGKTAILHKVYNRLFHEQEKVLPVYTTFAQYLHRDRPIDSYEFVEEFVGGYVLSYLAYQYDKPELFGRTMNFDELEEIAIEYPNPVLTDLFREYKSGRYGDLSSVYQLVKWAISVPMGFARQYNIPTALIIDEFQVLTNVYNPDSGRFNDVTNGFQHASETRWAPMLVSGSSVSMMTDEAIGGMLSGRFRPYRLGPLSQEHAIDMVLRLGDSEDIPVTEELAIAIWELTQGYPYPIECLLTSDAPETARLPDVEALNGITHFELTKERGALWEHYENEYGKYVRELNGDHTTRKILLWITNQPDDQLIRPKAIANAFDIDIMIVRDCLEKLNKVDVIKRASISSFLGPSDPLLRQFLKFEHYIDVDDLDREGASVELRQTVRQTLGEMNRRTGHFTEIIVGGVMNNFDEREVDGEPYFSVSESAKLPRMGKITRREGVLKEGIPKEIDVVGEHVLNLREESNADLGAWLVSVRYQKRKMSDDDVREFIDQVDALQSERRYGEITRWYFSKSGFTKKALALLESEGIYHSTLDQFNQLTALFGLLPLRM